MSTDPAPSQLTAEQHTPVGAPRRVRFGMQYLVGGTIITAAVITTASENTWDRPWQLVLRTSLAVLVLWFVHAVSDWIGHCFHARSRLHLPRLGHELLISLPTLATCALQLLPFALAALHLMSVDTASWLSYGVAVVVLGTVGWLLGVRRQASTARRIALALGIAMFGLVLIVLKEIFH